MFSIKIKMYNGTGWRKYGIFFSLPLLWWGGFSLAGQFQTPQPQNADYEFIPVAVHASQNADYGADPFNQQLAPINASIISSALIDRGVPQSDDADILGKVVVTGNETAPPDWAAQPAVPPTDPGQGGAQPAIPPEDPGSDNPGQGDVHNNGNPPEDPGQGNGNPPDDPGNGNGNPPDNPGNGNPPDDPGNGNLPDDPGNGNPPDDPGNGNPPDNPGNGNGNSNGNGQGHGRGRGGSSSIVDDVRI